MNPRPNDNHDSGFALIAVMVAVSSSGWVY